MNRQDIEKVVKEDLFGLVKAYYKDHITGSALIKRYGITLSDLLDYLDENQEASDKFNQLLEELASKRIERNCAVGIAHLVGELGSGAEPEGLKALQNAISTMLSVRKAFRTEVGEKDKIMELEQTLRNLGL